MKVREKLFVMLALIVVLLILVSSIAIISMLEIQTQQEKMQTAYTSLKSILMSYNHAVSDISSYVHTSCHNEYLANFMRQHDTYAVRTSIRLRLDSILSNSPYLEDGFLIRTDGELYFPSSNLNNAYYTLRVNEGLFDSVLDGQWIMDEGGRLFFCRTLYPTYPYVLTGLAVFEVDQEFLRTLVGMDVLTEGQICIIDNYGNITLTSANTSNHSLIFAALIDELRIDSRLTGEFTFSEDLYCTTAVRGQDGRWNAIYAVERSELLSHFNQLRRLIWIIAGALLLAAGVVSFWVSDIFTKNLRRLKGHIKQIRHTDDPDLKSRIPHISNDEVGILSQEFNRLLDRVEQLHQSSLQESQEKDRARYELLEFQYQALQSQVSPHFLCNIMAAINMLAASGSIQEVEQLSIDASRYLRRNLRYNNQKHNTVAEEIRLAAEYIQLANVISAVPLEFTVNCPKELEDCLIPNLILQPLVENSIKHGIPPCMEDTFHIQLSVDTEDSGALVLTIADNGVGYRQAVITELEMLQKDERFQPRSAGFGTAGVIRRLALQYGDSYRFQIHNHENGGAVTTILIPKS